MLTPNLAEAAALTGMPAISSLEGMKEAARQLHAKGAASVLVKGGHLKDEPDSGAPAFQHIRVGWAGHELRAVQGHLPHLGGNGQWSRLEECVQVVLTVLSRLRGKLSPVLSSHLLE